MSNFQTIDRETIRGTINGCNYAPKVHVLARNDVFLLVWAPGSSGWSGMYGNTYNGASMRVIKRHEHGARDIEICSGQRLKAQVFIDNAAKIDAIFGEGFHKLLETRKTIVVGDNAPFSPRGIEIPITGREFGYDYVMRQRAAYERLAAEGVTGVELQLRSMQEASE